MTSENDRDEKIAVYEAAIKAAEKALKEFKNDPSKENADRLDAANRKVWDAQSDCV